MRATIVWFGCNSLLDKMISSSYLYGVFFFPVNITTIVESGSESILTSSSNYFYSAICYQIKSMAKLCLFKNFRGFKVLSN
jgi:hypothetical protein